MTPDPCCIHGTPVDRQCLACAYMVAMIVYRYRLTQRQHTQKASR